MEIRKASLTDIPVLVDFQIKLAEESEGIRLDSEIVKQGMAALFADPSKGFYNVAQINNEIVGCHMITYEWSDWRNGMIWWLQSVYVKKSHRKMRVFKMMYDNLITEIKTKPELLGLRLYVDKTNDQGLKTYQAMGMDGSHYTVYEWLK